MSLLGEIKDLPMKINWTHEKVSSFKEAYNLSQRRKSKNKADMFVWQGYQFIPGYAKYLLEHLKNNGF